MKLGAMSITLVVCLAAVPAIAMQSASGNAVKQLPEPSGTYGIGRIGFDWVDASRPDRFAKRAGAHREMMVYLWYPAAKTADDKGLYQPGAKQMEADAQAAAFYREDDASKWQLIVSGALTSHARENAATAKGKQKFPLLVFVPGMGGTSFGYTALIEDLVSHGYAVASIEVPYNAPVVFSDGRILEIHRDTPQPGLSPEEQFKRMVAMAGLGIAEGAGDVRFVLDQLTAMQRKPRAAPMIAALDLDKAVAIGHSAGAASVARACQLDVRFKACIDLDGGMVPVSVLPDFGDGATMKQSVLLLEANYDESHMFGTHEQHMAYFKKKEEQLEQCPAGSFDVVLKASGLVHGSFSDDRLLGANDSASAAQALYNLNLIETYIRAFLERTLNGNRGTILDVTQHDDSQVMVRAYGN
ncbi:MAG TPA: hypothetical protein VKR52_03070 [Terracidiphilus sp.]|nr:hypothetical protein [Terracidiphilus sp.]